MTGNKMPKINSKVVEHIIAEELLNKTAPTVNEKIYYGRGRRNHLYKVHTDQSRGIGLTGGE